MEDFFKGLIKLLLSIAILLFGNDYFMKLMDYLNINLSGLGSNLLSLLIDIIILVCIYIIFKSEINSAFNRYKNKMGSNTLYTIISFVILFIAIMIVNYIVTFIANSLNITYDELSFSNIFNQTLSFDLIIKIIKDIIIIPFVKVIIFVFGVNDLFRSKTGILFSGLIYALYKMYVLFGFNESIIYMIINVIPYFAMYSILSYIYKKNNNIIFSAGSLILLEAFAGLLSSRFL